ncbi:hypothetical protein [Vibrio nigripulchritudo]|uniref:hypothetical protein n=1 Tax=Vibrio nigripulchritudo TaxID=28173 RepID=UPI0024933E2F|nr:hypothetical protein [Vibrio nigripulchritudo]
MKPWLLRRVVCCPKSLPDHGDFLGKRIIWQRYDATKRIQCINEGWMTAVVFDLVDVKQGDQNRIADGIAMSDAMRRLKRGPLGLNVFFACGFLMPLSHSVR